MQSYNPPRKEKGMERSITEKINIRATAKRIERLSIVFDELPEIIKLMDNEEREALSKE